MNAATQFAEAAQILRGLVTLPGASTVNIIGKKFPRLGPAEAGTGYMQEERSFPASQPPDTLPLEQGMDEIVITLQGELEESESTVGLLSQVSSLLGNMQCTACWDSRTFFKKEAGHPKSYQISVFTDVFGVVPGA